MAGAEFSPASTAQEYGGQYLVEARFGWSKLSMCSANDGSEYHTQEGRTLEHADFW